MTGIGYGAIAECGEVSGIATAPESGVYAYPDPIGAVAFGNPGIAVAFAAASMSGPILGEPSVALSFGVAPMQGGSFGVPRRSNVTVFGVASVRRKLGSIGKPEYDFSHYVSPVRSARFGYCEVTQW